MNCFTKFFIFLLFFSTFAQLSAKPSHTINQVSNLFQFQIQHYHTKRQAGQTLDVYVRYKLNKDLPHNQYPDYLALRKRVVKYLEPSKEFPENTYWEFIAEKIGNDLFQHFPIAGISVQLLVYPNEKGKIYEPGFHGPIYTKGNIPPLAALGPISKVL